MEEAEIFVFAMIVLLILTTKASAHSSRTISLTPHTLRFQATKDQAVAQAIAWTRQSDVCGIQASKLLINLLPNIQSNLRVNSQSILQLALQPGSKQTVENKINERQAIVNVTQRK